jgi:tetratricopeptide (TPR) repeat protein
MARTVQEITARIEHATQQGFRGQLVARGLARNLIWSEGKIPEGGQPFSPLLTSDLLSYGVALLQLGLELRSQERGSAVAIEAFERAAEAIESVVRDGDPAFNDRGFYAVLAAAAYHLGHFSARAFSLFPSELESLNLSPAERSLVSLMRRDLAQLRATLVNFAGAGGFDETLSAELEQVDDGSAVDAAVFLTLNSLYHKALAIFDYALDSGSADAVASALAMLDDGIAASAEYASVPFWWIFSITRHLLDDLWDQSLHMRLPESPDDGSKSKWTGLRQLFIAKLARQDRAEIEVWPSQLEAAARALDMTDDLVAALPTSAGKTRIAEICILRALSLEKRIVFVTPLRALSAQTERSLRQIFTALGFSVSSLYGSSGTTGDDSDSLRNRNIVVTTPEKLDFALRNDASLLDDVGLVVFDEAHTIGAGEREIRYEVLVQRLLRRTDADERRIVCLSAILPKGEQLQDFLSWMRQDRPGSAITVNWRPTRQRFGEIDWRRDEELTAEGDLSNNQATLRFRLAEVGDDAPYVAKFVVGVPARGQQKKSLPRDRRDLCLMTAWKLVEEGQSVLLYCPERRSVLPLATVLIDLVRRGYLPSLLKCDPALLNEALNIGREWLGENHPAVQCLSFGVAVHHGKLPRPFLRAIERLLKEQYLSVTIASPTLAQGLNLSATTVLFCGTKRGRSRISGEEFANVAGRAGRAFVDVEGQVICAIWERKHLREWEKLLKDAQERDLKSGLLQLILDFSSRISVKKKIPIEKVLEYVTGNVDIWTPPKPRSLDSDEEKAEQEEFERKWRADLACLDSALLSLVQHDVPLEALAKAIDEALKSSLWERSLRREGEITQKISRMILEKRAGFIWTNSTPTQRKGYFFAGLSLATGLYLDKHGTELKQALIAADTGFAEQDIDAAYEALLTFANIAFGVEPFKQDELPETWKAILKAWISGHRMSDLAGNKEEATLEFIEDALVYRLVWAMEAVRVRQSAEADNTDWPNAGRAALALETGTPDYCAALLIQNGLASRVAALKAVAECPANFTDIRGMRQWVRSPRVAQKQANPNWPTPETTSLWDTFVAGLATSSAEKWDRQEGHLKVTWDGEPPDDGTPVRLIYNSAQENMRVFSTDLEPLGFLPYHWKSVPGGIALGEVTSASREIEITYLGPSDFFSH